MNKFKKSLPLSIHKLQKRHHSNIGIIGVPFWYGQSKSGVDHAPNVLRSHGLINKLSTCFGWEKVTDFGNISIDIKPEEINVNDFKRWENPNEFNLWRITKKTSQCIANIIETGNVPLMIGGDHSMAIGSIMGVEHALSKIGKKFSVIWIDAHADANTIQSSLSKNLHGMPVSFLLKNSSNKNQHFKHCIDAKNFAFIGLRDVEIQELKLLKELNINYFSMRDVDCLGINEVVARALDRIDPTNENYIHISYDVDSMDPMFIPSTGTPVNGGLTLRETLQIAETISKTDRMIALDVVEFNPKLGTDEDVKKSAQHTIDIILAFFGKSRLGSYSFQMENFK